MAGPAVHDARAGSEHHPQVCGPIAAGEEGGMNATILWVIAVVLVVIGIVQLLQGQILFGIALIVVGALVGPGGVSIFNRRN
jgi:hypothetical protein